MSDDSGLSSEPRSIHSPLVAAAIAFALGILWDREAGEWASTTSWSVLAFVGLAVALVGRDRRIPAVAGLFLALVCVGAGRHHQAWTDLAPDDLSLRGVGDQPKPAWVRGVLWEVQGPRVALEAHQAPGFSPTTRGVLALTAFHDGQTWRRASGWAQLIIVGDRADLRAGEAVEGAGALSTIAGPLNPGEFDYRAHLRARRIRLRFAVDTQEGIWHSPDEPNWLWANWLGRVRAWSHNQLVSDLSPSVAPLAAALLLGQREGVDPDVNDAFARTGTTHLLAISGLHLQVLAIVCLWFLRMLGLGRRKSYGAVALATVTYALLVGLAPSVVRSAAMTVAACAACWFDRQVRPANHLSLAALVTLMINPTDLFDVGCQLSFLAIAVLLWGVKPVSQWLTFVYYALTFRLQGPGSPLDRLERSLEPWWRSKLRKWLPLVKTNLVISSLVWLVAMPLVAYRFHIVSPIGILLNLPLVPLTSFALMCAGLTLAFSACAGVLGVPFAWACAWALMGTERIVRWGAAQSWGHRFVPGPSLSWTLVAYLLLALAVSVGVNRWRGRTFAWASLAAWGLLGAAITWFPERNRPMEAEVLAVGHGLAVVLQPGDGTTYLYDCGRMRDPTMGRRIVAPALWMRGVSRIDRVMLSHADSDHYVGLLDLLPRFSIGEVLIPPGFADLDNPGARHLVETLRAFDIPVRTIARGTHWERNGADFTVLHPPMPDEESGGYLAATSDNARSLVLDVVSGGRHFLLTGDLEREGLSRLLECSTDPLEALLVPHHGARAANPPAFYDWASPQLAIVSQRPPNGAAYDPLKQVEERGISVLRTWQRGAIRLRWEPQALVARGFLDTLMSPTDRSLTLSRYLFELFDFEHINLKY